MKKLIIYLVLVGVLIFLGSLGWALGPITPLTPNIKAFTDNNMTTPAFSMSSTIILQLVLLNDTTWYYSSQFQYWGVDSATGYGIQIYDGINGADTVDISPTIAPPGQRSGTMVQIQGHLDFYFNTVEFVPTSGANTSLWNVVGTGYGYSTVLVPSISAMTSVDSTALTGGEYYMGRLVRLNNVSLVPTAASVISLMSTGILLAGGASGNYPMYDPSVSAASSVMLYFTGNVGTTLNNTGGVHQMLSIITAGAFDVIGIFNKYSPGPSYNPQGYEIYVRGLATDFVSTTIHVTPQDGITHPGGNTISLNANGGMEPFTWSLSNYSFGTIDSNGLFSPSASTTGTVTAIATDYIGRQGGASIEIRATSAPLVPDIDSDTVKAIMKPSE